MTGAGDGDAFGMRDGVAGAGRESAHVVFDIAHARDLVRCARAEILCCCSRKRRVRTGREPPFSLTVATAVVAILTISGNEAMCGHRAACVLVLWVAALLFGFIAPRLAARPGWIVVARRCFSVQVP